jgi:hypothetical protein
MPPLIDAKGNRQNRTFGTLFFLEFVKERSLFPTINNKKENVEINYMQQITNAYKK